MKRKARDFSDEAPVVPRRFLFRNCGRCRMCRTKQTCLYQLPPKWGNVNTETNQSPDSAADKIFALADEEMVERLYGWGRFWVREKDHWRESPRPLLLDKDNIVCVTDLIVDHDELSTFYPVRPLERVVLEANLRTLCMLARAASFSYVLFDKEYYVFKSRNKRWEMTTMESVPSSCKVFTKDMMDDVVGFPHQYIEVEGDTRKRKS